MSDQLERLKQSQRARREMLSQWRSNRLVEKTLPSGMIVWLKDVSMMDLVLTGKLPEGIMDFVEKSTEDGKNEIDLKEVAKAGPGMGEMMNILAMLCIVEPPVAEIGDEEHLGLNEITGDDKMFIMNWANREVKEIRPFREGEMESVATVQPGDGLLQETQ
jgi:hypothetical protein